MEPVVQTSFGTLRGVEAKGLYVFRGIGFARPPVGPLRFRPPGPPDSWEGVRDATRFGAAAPQSLGLLGPIFSMGIAETSEDCLHLNVWTPGLDSRRRPVLVWIHGGAFVLGAGSQTLYDGAALARRGDVVVVTINYRLGALGFLCARELSQGRIPATGNEGLLDQIAALAWVQEEIARFGGDPDNVTIFGESAGAMSCATLLAAPGARGRFRRAILQSGAGNFVAPIEAAAQVGTELLDTLGLQMRRIESVLDLPPERIIEAQARLFFTLRPGWKRLRLLLALIAALRRALERLATRSGKKRRLLPFLVWPLTLPLRAVELLAASARIWPQGLPLEPVVDGVVLPRLPLDAISAGSAKDVPILIGTNLDEVKLFRFLDRESKKLDEAALLARCEVAIPGHNGEVSHGRRAIEVYRRARAARGEPTTPPELWFAIETDRTMRYPAMRLAEVQSQHQARTFAYLFTWTSPFAGGSLGSCHALDLPFVFGTLTHPLLRGFTGRGPEAMALAERMQDSWIAFARTGDPSHDGIGSWPGYERTRRATMILGRECRVEAAPREPERAFWESLDGGRQ